jgi:acyl-CoA thioesterase-1
MLQFLIQDFDFIINTKNMRSLHSSLTSLQRYPNKILGFMLLFGLPFLLLSCKDRPKDKENEKDEVVTTAKNERSEEQHSKKVIMFYGNSLTAGYRLEENESFPSIIEDRIDSLELDYVVINAGLSGDTSYDGLKRLDWVLNTKIDLFILELGANDMLRGLPLKNTRENLFEIVKMVKSRYPEAKIAICAMAGAPNMGTDYVTEFEKIYRDLAAKEEITYIPFFLEGVAGHPDLLLQDGKHPNAEGQKIVAENIWGTLKNLL